MRVRLAGGAASPGVIRVLRETLENSVEPVQRLRALWALLLRIRFPTLPRPSHDWLGVRGGPIRIK